MDSGEGQRALLQEGSADSTFSVQTEPAAETRAPLELEDFGGQAVDDADEPEDSEVEEAGTTRMIVTDKVQDIKWIQRLLARWKEIAKACQFGLQGNVEGGRRVWFSTWRGPRIFPGGVP